MVVNAVPNPMLPQTLKKIRIGAFTHQVEMVALAHPTHLSNPNPAMEYIQKLLKMLAHKIILFHKINLLTSVLLACNQQDQASAAVEMVCLLMEQIKNVTVVPIQGTP